VFVRKWKKLIVDLALKAAKKIVGIELEQKPDTIIDIVSNTLKPVAQHEKITIFVHPQDIKILEENRPKLKAILEMAKSLSIEENADIKRGGCVVETEAGIINAELEHQWLALETAFKNLMKQGK